MAAQLFLWGKLAGIEGFILEHGPEHGGSALAGRCLWVSLLSEVLPRAVLAECGLSEVLLGVCGGGEFLMVLPPESLEAAEAVLTPAAEEVSLAGYHGVENKLCRGRPGTPLPAGLFFGIFRVLSAGGTV